MRRLSRAMFFVLVLMLALGQQRTAHANVINGSVSLDTSGLSGTFELAFVFIDGSGTADANNTATFRNFEFGGGNAGPVDTLATTIGASGDFASGVSIVDSEFFNVFAQTFTAGAVVTFDFALTTNVDAGGTPDQFSLALLQSDGSPVPSSDASGALLVANIDSAQPAFLAFATEFTPAPIVTLAASVPEPSSLLLLVIALMAAPWSARARLSGFYAGSAHRIERCRYARRMMRS